MVLIHSLTKKKSESWYPPVNTSHIREDKQVVLRQRCTLNSNAFAREDHDIGCISDLQMTIALKNNIHVQRSYAAIRKLLY